MHYQSLYKFYKKAIRAQIFRGLPTSMPLVNSKFGSLFTELGDIKSREEYLSYRTTLVFFPNSGLFLLFALKGVYLDPFSLNYVNLGDQV